MDPQPTMTPDEKPVEQSLEQPTQEVAAPESAPIVTPVAVPIASIPVAAQAGSKKFAIWSLVLALLALLTGILFFVSGPLAIAALILGIVALVKHKAGKGMSIAAIVISGVALLLVPLWATIALVALSGIQQATLESNAKTDNTVQTQQQ